MTTALWVIAICEFIRTVFAITQRHAINQLNRNLDSAHTIDVAGKVTMEIVEGDGPNTAYAIGSGGGGVGK